MCFENYNSQKMICYFPGVSYLDFPGNLLMQRVPGNRVVHTAICPEPPVAWPDPTLVRQAARLLMTAKRPLIIVGKGIYYIYFVFIVPIHFL